MRGLSTLWDIWVAGSDEAMGRLKIVGVVAVDVALFLGYTPINIILGIRKMAVGSWGIFVGSFARSRGIWPWWDGRMERLGNWWGYNP